MPKHNTHREHENREARIARAADQLVQGQYATALELLDSIAIDFEEDPLGSAIALRGKLKALQMLRRWQEAIEIGESLIPNLTTCPLPTEICLMHGSVGVAHVRVGNHRRAEDHLRAAVHLALWEVRDQPTAVRHQKELGVMFKNLGMWAQARHEYVHALRIADDSKIEEECGALRINLAILDLKSGNIVSVPDLLSEAETRLSLAGGSPLTVNVHLARAKYLRLTGDTSEALRILSRALTAARELSRTREEAIGLEYLGDCYLAMREYRKALEHYEAAQKIAEATAPRGDLVPELGHRLGEALTHLGDPNAAILRCEHGLRIAKETGDRYEECATHRVLAMAHRAAGNPTKAFRLIAEGIALGRQYEIPYELALALQWSGETRLQTKHRDEQMIGRMQLWEARAIYERIGLPNMVRTLDQILGFEEASPADADDPTAPVLAGIANLDRGAYRFGIVTTSAEVSQAVATIQSVAPSRIPVLISGESGVGKELIARALHQMSDRRRQPFIAVNCGALAPGLLDSELFGHERGAFTGAIASRDGLFASADKGTLFLDEVGELSSTAQSTLLRILENGELRPVGRDEVKTIDVRIVAATNADLEELVDRGSFRRDLFYRLEGVSVRVPPLSEREDDIRALFRYFFAQAAAAARKRLTVSEDVEPMLVAYGWPGNVRELKHEVARAVAMAEDGAVLGREAFLPKLASKSPTALRHAREVEGANHEERQRILSALRAHRGNKADAARSLDGMKRTTLIYKMERLGIRPEEYQVKE